MNNQYLCYDLKGIQSYIFKIPKLKYIIGGSALVDQFDRKTSNSLSNESRKLIFSGGGKGAFYCSEDVVEDLKNRLISEAHEIGLDIRFGIAKKFSEASQNADELYSFIPDMMSGKPCPTSGLYPVKDNNEHPIVKKRIFNKGELIFRYFENKLLPHISIEGINPDNLYFFHDVDIDGSEQGYDGAQSLGSRNRWAVISMDGNDMGMQFRHQVDKDNSTKLSDKQLLKWLKKMSFALDNCSTQATIAGIQKVINSWLKSKDGQKALKFQGDIALPIRPIVVGGDDIIILCHSEYALEFAREAIRIFNMTSQKTAELWPATNGELTISAGILYASISLPLHTAIPYSEALLASAKTKGRKLLALQDKKASPACIDWEVVTDSFIDTPAAKRQRELIFKDNEINRTIKLTHRPYAIEELDSLDKMIDRYSKVPSSVRSRVFSSLKQNYCTRLAYYASVKKNHANSLFIDLNEYDKNNLGVSWIVNHQENEQSTSVIDAITLLEETARMSKETV